MESIVSVFSVFIIFVVEGYSVGCRFGLNEIDLLVVCIFCVRWNVSLYDDVEIVGVIFVRCRW